ncbi:MAG: preprotein translocase subunit SecE [Bacteroidota bacterium]|jgi:preprotein translocase subunit SecE|nr:preprotein translocase subunit SecE [Bacteroidia bacterium]NBX19239.1 preprotein translocase subunit SecE [Bacteroidia bacterium]NBY09511.1 preprotein translocase subunit SecE [Sphingobacteriia bacterium]
MSKISNYLTESRNELFNKVSWPTWSELQNSAWVVMASAIIIALVVFVLDFVFEFGMTMLYDLFK